jgi:hypothetical protein
MGIVIPFEGTQERPAPSLDKLVALTNAMSS